MDGFNSSFISLEIDIHFFIKTIANIKEITKDKKEASLKNDHKLIKLKYKL